MCASYAFVAVCCALLLLIAGNNSLYHSPTSASISWMSHVIHPIGIFGPPLSCVFIVVNVLLAYV